MQCAAVEAIGQTPFGIFRTSPPKNGNPHSFAFEQLSSARRLLASQLPAVISTPPTTWPWTRDAFRAFIFTAADDRWGNDCTLPLSFQAEVSSDCSARGGGGNGWYQNNLFEIQCNQCQARRTQSSNQNRSISYRRRCRWCRRQVPKSLHLAREILHHESHYQLPTQRGNRVTARDDDAGWKGSF